MAKTPTLLVLVSLCGFLCSCGEKSTVQAKGADAAQQSDTKADDKIDGQGSAAGSNTTPVSTSAKPAAPA